jgi:hypothetical protein
MVVAFRWQKSNRETDQSPGTYSDLPSRRKSSGGCCPPFTCDPCWKEDRKETLTSLEAGRAGIVNLWSIAFQLDHLELLEIVCQRLFCTSVFRCPPNGICLLCHSVMCCRNGDTAGAPWLKFAYSLRKTPLLPKLAG